MIRKMIMTLLFLMVITGLNFETVNAAEEFAGSRRCICKISKSDLNNFVSGGQSSLEMLLAKNDETRYSCELDQTKRYVYLILEYSFRDYEEYEEKTQKLIGYQPITTYEQNEISYMENFDSTELFTFLNLKMQEADLLSEIEFGELLSVEKDEFTKSVKRMKQNQVVKFETISIDTVLEDGLYTRSIFCKETESSGIRNMKRICELINASYEESGDNQYIVTFTVGSEQELIKNTMIVLDTDVNIIKKKHYSTDQKIRIETAEHFKIEDALSEDGTFEYDISLPEEYLNIVSPIVEKGLVTYSYETDVFFDEIIITTDFSRQIGKTERKISFYLDGDIADDYHEQIKTQFSEQVKRGDSLKMYDESGRRCYEFSHASWFVRDIERFTERILGAVHVDIDIKKSCLPFLKSIISESFDVESIFIPSEDERIQSRYMLPSNEEKNVDGKFAYSETVEFSGFYYMRLVGCLIAVLMICVSVRTAISKMKPRSITKKEKEKKNMFCTNCGKEIKDGARFCVHCGSSQVSGGGTQSYMPAGKNGNGNAANSLKGFVEGMTVLDIGIILLYIVIIARWFGVFVSNLDYTWELFDYIESDLRLLLMVLFLIPFGIVCLLCLVGIRSVKTKEYHISLSVIIAVFALVVKVAAFLLRNVAFGSTMYAGYIVLLLYGGIGVFTIILCIVNSILLNTKANSSMRYR